VAAKCPPAGLGDPHAHYLNRLLAGHHTLDLRGRQSGMA
jgi:hypothetical protein